jgi:hypothetical protein
MIQTMIQSSSELPLKEISILLVDDDPAYRFPPSLFELRRTSRSRGILQYQIAAATFSRPMTRASLRTSSF